MTGEISYFRKRFFGGFNKQDVVEYIVKMAKERNELEDEKNKIAENTNLFADEIARLSKKINEMQRQMDSEREKKEAIFISADRTCDELEQIFEKYIGEIEVAVAAINESFSNVGISIAKIPETLTQAGETFKELRMAFSSEINGAGRDLSTADDDRAIALGQEIFAAKEAAAGLAAGIIAASDGMAADKAAAGDTASGEAEIFVA